MDYVWLVLRLVTSRFVTCACSLLPCRVDFMQLLFVCILRTVGRFQKHV